MSKHLFKVSCELILRLIQRTPTSATTSSSRVCVFFTLDFIANYDDIKDIPEDQF